MIKKSSVLLFLVVFFSASSAYASKTVTGPGVKGGDAFIESKSEYVVDDNDSKDGEWKQKVNTGYGVTSYWGTEIEATWEGSEDDDTDFTSVEWKNKFQFTDQKTFGFDTGARIGYTFDMTGDDPDEVEIKLLGQKDIGAFSHRANVIFSKQVGHDAANDVDLGLAWSSKYKYADYFQPGFEIYNSFGEMGGDQEFEEQDHRIGPVFYGKLGNGFSYDAGYLFGISENAPDGTVKAIVRYSW